MPLNQRIHDQFHASINTLVDASDLISEPIARAAQILTDCFMQEGKILACGQGISGLAAQHACGILVNQLEKERPGLAAIVLPDNVAMRDGTELDANTFARQISALGQQGDVLLAISTFGLAPALIEAARAAQQREMIVIALVGGEGGALAEILREEDVLICAPANSPARIHETFMFAVHALCDGVDFLLLGA
jgi:D-sedoheptulose 7-phosphate isomerase